MDNQTAILNNLASNTASIIGNLNLEIAKLQSENQILKAKNAELNNQNNNLRKGGSLDNESINNHAANK
ncbi:hypothetical protein [Lactobacillus intestinalis]|uniref:hypothetical protein n=1 Tax=Lactobacillus intestinalis TaxID=151781 RepID=UPI002670189D|nr:hypothetical protein [Lactobacillus intestinalis]